MAEYQLSQSGPTVQEAINIALEVTALLQQEVAARQAGDAANASAEALAAERTRAEAAEALLAPISSLAAEVARAQAAEEALVALINAIKALIPTVASDENQLADKVFVTGITDEMRDAIAAIEGLIPEQASETNQLADKAFVNSSLNSTTASLITDNGEPFTSLSDLQQVTARQNDYAYVIVSASGGTYYDRYKYSAGQWVLEFRVNSTVFTSAQWNAVNSGATTELMLKLLGLPDNIVPITAEDIDEICV